MSELKEELFCKCCNYKTDRNYDWLKHIKSQKHLRNGEKKIKRCTLCEYETMTHWNLRMHTLTNHSTLEERVKEKYYCNLCDVVFFCKTYQDKHNTGKHHLTKLKVKESLDIINNKII